jgi:hypothetical protein
MMIIIIKMKIMKITKIIKYQNLKENSNSKKWQLV